MTGVGRLHQQPVKKLRRLAVQVEQTAAAAPGALGRRVVRHLDNVDARTLGKFA